MFLQFGPNIIWALLFSFLNAFMVPYGYTFKPFLSLFSGLACREIRVLRDLRERMCLSLDTGGMETGSGRKAKSSLQPEFQYLQLRSPVTCTTVLATESHSADVSEL